MQHHKNMSKEDLLEVIESLENSLDEVCYAYSMILDHVTNGKMSKPYLDVQMVKSVIDDCQNEQFKDWLKDELQELGIDSQ